MRVVGVVLVFVLCLMMDSSAVFGKADRGVTIVRTDKASWMEKHAAEEFAKYAFLLTGRKPDILSHKDKRLAGRKDLVVIGFPSSHPFVEKLARKGVISPSAIAPGTDGFIIKSFTDGGRNYLVLAANTRSGLIYSVYHYFEECCEVGFFQDGERIPGNGELALTGVSMTENPRFKYRNYLRWNRRVLKKYTAYWDSWEELKAKIDWQLKEKTNFIGVADVGMDNEGVEMAGITEEVFGLDQKQRESFYAPDGWWLISWVLPPDYVVKRKDRALDYGRKCGMIADCWIPFGAVPKRYKDAHPEHRYVEGPWPQLDPADPMARTYTERLVKRSVKRFGTDHYYSMNAYGEQALGKDPLRLKIDATLQTADLIRSVDPSPEVIWRTDAPWDFMVNPGGIWTPESVKKYLDALPGFVYLADNTVDLLKPPQYEKYDYYYGKKWAFAVINDLGGDDHLHGDIEDVLTKIQKVAKDPAAGNCIGFHMVPENSGLGVMYWEFMTKMAWNPEGLTVDNLIDHYVTRRYGRISKVNMTKACRVLMEAMKPRNPRWTSIRPLYKYVNRYPKGYLRKNFDNHLTIVEEVLPLFRESLLCMLKEEKNQSGNKLYENDVVDVARTYLGKLSDYNLVKLDAAYQAGDVRMARDCEKRMYAAVDWIARIISTREDYSLARTVQAAKSVPGVNPRIEEIIKLASCGQGYDTFDAVEQMGYYKKVLGAFVDDEIRGTPSSSYADLEREWIRSPFRVDNEHSFEGATLDAVRRAVSYFDEITPFGKNAPQAKSHIP